MGVAVAVAPFAASAHPFHSGGVAECDGCHTMHNSFAGETTDADLTHLSAGPYLLKGNDLSSVCLNCHAANDPVPALQHVMTYPFPAPGSPPVNHTPGGDFAWLQKTYTWQPRTGTTETSLGDRKGHNVVAVDFGLTADAALSVAPGGDYPAAALACPSCHDPHGKYRRFSDGTIVDGKTEPTLPIRSSGSYAESADPVDGIYAVGAFRHLAGVGYQPKSLAGSFAFQAHPFAAVAPDDYNRDEDTTQTRVAYGAGVSAWCANCHPAMHANTGMIHPTGQAIGGAIAANYNLYVKTGDLTGTLDRSYLSLVPFEEATADYAVLKAHARIDDSVLSGPAESDVVMCLSCHRAHATAFDSMLRWSSAYEFITLGDGAGVPNYGDPTAAPGSLTAVAQGRTVAETQAAYHGRPATAFAPYQRSLCNKCHVKD